MNLEWLLINDASQVEAWGQQRPTARQPSLMIVEDMAAAAELERHGLPFVEPWDMLTAADIDVNREAASTLARSWWNESLASTCVEGFCFAQAAAEDWAWPLEICLNATLAWKRILEQYPPQRIVGHWLPPIAIFNTQPAPVFRAAVSLSEAVLRWRARAMRVKLAAAAPIDLHRPRATNGRWRRFTASRSGMQQWPARGALPAPNNKTVLIVKEGLDRRELPALESAINASGCWQAAIVCLLPAMLTPLPRQVESFMFQAARAACRQRMASYIGPHPEIFGNEDLWFQFDRVWDGMEEAARSARRFGAVLDRIRPDLVVFGHEAFTLARALEHQAKRRGIPTVALIHGGFGHVGTMRGIVGDADRLLVWNDMDRDALCKFEVAAERQRVVGSIRYAATKRLDSPKPNEKSRARRRLRLPAARPAVAFITAAVHSGLASPIAIPKAHRATWRELVTLAARRPDISYVIKPHPSYDHNEYLRALVQDAPANVYLLDGVPLQHVFDASDAVVMVNYATTAGLEALLAGVPLIWLKTALWPGTNRDAHMPAACAAAVGSVEEMDALVDRWQQNPEECAQAQANQQAVADRVIGRSLQPVAKRVVEALRELPKADRIDLPPTRQTDLEAARADCIALSLFARKARRFSAGLRAILAELRRQGTPREVLAALRVFAWTTWVQQRVVANDGRTAMRWSTLGVCSHPWSLLRSRDFRRLAVRSWLLGLRVGDRP